jgi:hypothetical protein
LLSFCLYDGTIDSKPDPLPTSTFLENHVPDLYPETYVFRKNQNSPRLSSLFEKPLVAFFSNTYVFSTPLPRFLFIFWHSGGVPAV